MAQVFHRSANAFARASIFGVVFALAVIAGVAYVMVRSNYATRINFTPAQPVPFSHAHHVGGDGIDCRYCHTSVETSSFAGIPPTKTCMNCHSQIWANSPLLAPVRESYETGKPIEWKRVYDLPEFVYFNHSIHIAKGIGCSTCHGRVDKMQLTYKVTPLNMGWCLDCHANPAKYVRPKSEVFNMEWTPPANQLELGHELVKRYGIQSKTSCSVCHR